jgi:hypothetical protein
MGLTYIASKCIMSYIKYILNEEYKANGDDVDFLRIKKDEWSKNTTIFPEHTYKDMRSLIRIWNDRKSYNDKNMKKWYSVKNYFESFIRDNKSWNKAHIKTYEEFKRKFICSEILNKRN